MKILGPSSKKIVSIDVYCFSADPDIIPEARDFRRFQKFLQKGKGPAICASDYRRCRKNFPHCRVTIYYSWECSIWIPSNKRKLDYRIRRAEDRDEYQYYGEQGLCKLLEVWWTMFMYVISSMVNKVDVSYQ